MFINLLSQMFSYNNKELNSAVQMYLLGWGSNINAVTKVITDVTY